MNFKRFFKITLCLFCLSQQVLAEKKDNDPHYTSKGFFDIHVCNWPQRPLFLLAVFSTKYFNDIKSIKIFFPDGVSVGEMDLTQFRQFKNKHKQVKKVFLKQFELPSQTTDGWYKAVITLNDNTIVYAKDLVRHKTMAMAKVYQPANNAKDIKLPKKLSWNKIQSAGFYQVFIRDIWDDGKLIYKSMFLQQNQLILPDSLLQKGGYYSWRLHVRDVNGDVLLGDFNHGSLSPKLFFSVED